MNRSSARAATAEPAVDDAGAEVEARAFTLRHGSDDFLVLSVPAPRSAGLSPAEETVRACLLAGLSNTAIARQRGTSERTVANQVSRIFRKMGVRSRSELAALHRISPPRPRSDA